MPHTGQRIAKHRSNTLHMPRKSFQQVAENPLIDLTRHPRRRIEEFYAALPRGRGPRNFAAGFHSQLWVAQFEAHSYLLVKTRRRHRLYSHAFMAQVADYTTVRLIES